MVYLVTSTHMNSVLYFQMEILIENGKLYAMLEKTGFLPPQDVISAGVCMVVLHQRENPCSIGWELWFLCHDLEVRLEVGLLWCCDFSALFCSSVLSSVQLSFFTCEGCDQLCIVEISLSLSFSLSFDSMATFSVLLVVNVS